MYAVMSNRPNHPQLEALVDFLERNPGIAKGSLRTALGKDLVKKRWNEVSSFLNGLGTVTKDGKGWAKFWAEKKCVLKKKCLQLQVGPLEDPPIFSDIEKRMVAMVGMAEFPENTLEDNNIEDTYHNYSELHEEVDIKSPIVNHRSSNGDFLGAASTLNHCYDDEEEHLTNSRHSSYKRAHSEIEQDIDVARLEGIEQKRAKAERVKAAAFRAMSSELARHTEALARTAGALRGGGEGVAAALQAAGTDIAQAIARVSKRLGSAH